MATALVIAFILMTPAALAVPIGIVYIIVSKIRHDRMRKKIAEPYHKILHDAIERV